MSDGSEGVAPPKLTFPNAEAHLMRALELDPDHGDSHAALGLLYAMYYWDLDGAEKEVVRADELGSERGTRNMYFLRSYAGRFDEAIQWTSRALRRDPLSIQANLNVGQAYYWARQYQKSVDATRKAVELGPGSSKTWQFLAESLAASGDRREAIEALRKALELADLDDWAGDLAKDFAAFGWEKAQRNLTEKQLEDKAAVAKEGVYVSPLDFAGLNALLGNRDEAFKWLDKAVEDRSSMLIALRIDPMWDSIRSDPRFAGVAARILPMR